MIGVIDADQNLIGTRGTEVQVRDAAFSLYAQSAYSGDTHLDAESLFDDSRDYSAPLKPQAGMIIPELGLTMLVTEQANDSSSATVEFALADGSILPEVDLTADITAEVTGAKVNFSAAVSGGSGYTYAWSFGVSNATSTASSPSYTYPASGDYIVNVLVTDSAGNTVNATKTVRVVIAPVAAFTLTQTDASVSMTNNSTQGFGGLTYLWNFGDGSASSTAQSPSYTYTQSGTYAVILVATDSLGNESSVSQNVTVTVAVTTTPTAPTTTTSTDSSSGGGSLGGLSMMLLVLVGTLRKRVN